jgi:hypothetical protein
MITIALLVDRTVTNQILPPEPLSEPFAALPVDISGPKVTGDEGARYHIRDGNGLTFGAYGTVTLKGPGPAVGECRTRLTSCTTEQREPRLTRVKEVVLPAGAERSEAVAFAESFTRHD